MSEIVCKIFKDNDFRRVYTFFRTAYFLLDLILDNVLIFKI